MEAFNKGGRAAYPVTDYMCSSSSKPKPLASFTITITHSGWMAEAITSLLLLHTLSSNWSSFRGLGVSYELEVYTRPEGEAC